MHQLTERITLNSRPVIYSKTVCARFFFHFSIYLVNESFHHSFLQKGSYQFVLSVYSQPEGKFLSTY